MAKAQAAKPKFSFADLFKGKPKPVARPPSHASTQTNIPVAGGSATRSGQSAKAAPASMRGKEAMPAAGGLAGFRLPFIGDKPLTAQLQILGTVALLLFALAAFMVFEDTRQRTRTSTYVTITSQMQYHTQRLAKAAGIAARGDKNAFAQLQDSRDEFANYLGVLQNGGFAFDVQVPPAGTTEELNSRLQELAKRWPETA
ncbi:MAG: type IV pili methyl-accepting chemotaxis transducer N-terminal domain-containing protein, partial [Usitatibacter sp.]